MRVLSLFLKLLLKREQRNTRLIFNSDRPLSPAQILHNGLCHGNKFEICLWRSKDKIYLARTCWVQNLEAYSKRDMARRKNLRAGILPPKLAQIILNLTRLPQESLILDPFCGNGSLLQEALLMGYKVAGSDVDRRQIDICSANLRQFMATEKIKQGNLLDLSVADATSHQWLDGIGGIASEIDLGPPLNRQVSVKYIEPHRHRLEALLREFLANAAGQLASSSRLCLAVPAWPQPNGDYLRLNSVACLVDLGYSLESQELIYRRPNQFVGRQLLVLEKV